MLDDLLLRMRSLFRLKTTERERARVRRSGGAAGGGNGTGCDCDAGGGFAGTSGIALGSDYRAALRVKLRRLKKR